LVLAWYGANLNDDSLRISPSDRFDYELDENNIQITGLVVSKSGEVDYEFGTMDYSGKLVRESNDNNAEVRQLNSGGVDDTPFIFSEQLKQSG
jgi:hypothetical protein